ncbi:MAG: hypothetical protein RIQ94_939 [Pseudomonadota bacterium]
MQTINGKDLALFASDKLQIWSDLIEAKVTHVEYGSGEILSVEQRPGYIPLIRIKFSRDIVTFNSDSFLSGKTSVLINVSLAERVEEWAKTAADREQECAEQKALKINNHEIALNCERENRHRAFLEERGIPYQGVRLATKVRNHHRITHCYSCKRHLDNAIMTECVTCGWILCNCGACGCGWIGH